jgi:hypothetical protein
MLLAPGLIAVRILWRKKEIRREDYKFIVSDYIVYSFLIHSAVYGSLFFTFPDRTVSFSAEVTAWSNILLASFVFKYSIASLLAALILPATVSWLAKSWLSLEEKRTKRVQESKK